MDARAERRSTRPLYWLLGVVLAGLVAWTAWPRALPVETAPVVEGPLTVSFIEEGRTRLRDRYLVSMPVAGIVERIALEPGDAVEVGQPVAHLRPMAADMLDPASRARAQALWRSTGDALQAARAAVEAAGSRHADATRQAARMERLGRDRLVAAAEADEARVRASVAAADLRAARSLAHARQVERDSAAAVLSLQGQGSGGEGARIALHAPHDGRVIRRFVESEGPVVAGAPLLELGDPGDLEVEVDVLTSQAVRIGPGTRVRLDGWGGRALEGRVRAVEPGGFTKVSALGVEEQRVRVLVDLPMDAATPLGDGYRIDAEFITWHAEAVPRVPTAALFRDGSTWAVYALDSGRARLRHIRVGQVGVEAAQLLGGLPPGARVIVWPGDRVRDGQRVREAAPVGQ